MSACVLPIAPEFQDPTASQNYTPYITSADPAIGSVVATPSFHVTVSDPNVGDDLHVRWIANFPPNTGDTRVFQDFPILHRPDGRPLFTETVGEPTCGLALVPRVANHRIMLVVADRPFLAAVQPGSPEVDLARVPSDAHVVVASWTLDRECP